MGKSLFEIDGILGFKFLSVQHGTMEAGLLCEHFFKALLPPKITDKSMLSSYWASVCKFLSAAQKASVQVWESSNDQDHADRHVERRSIDPSKEAIAIDSFVRAFHTRHMV
jgi:hypothetical protein